MMTKNSSYSRIVAVWLVLLAFLCGMIVPSLALAIQDMDIEMEGDPGDGLGATGGGGGFQNDQGSSEAPIVDSIAISFSSQLWSIPNNRYLGPVFLIPIWENGHLQFVIIHLDYTRIEAAR